MKSCVVTANYACDPNKVWLYLTKPTLNGWRRDVSSVPFSDQRNTTTSPAATAQSSIFQNTPSPPMPQSMGRRALLCQLKIEVKP